MEIITLVTIFVSGGVTDLSIKHETASPIYILIPTSNGWLIKSSFTDLHE